MNYLFELAINDYYEKNQFTALDFCSSKDELIKMIKFLVSEKTFLGIFEPLIFEFGTETEAYGFKQGFFYAFQFIYEQRFI